MVLSLGVRDARVAVIGLGYVGLPLSVAFARKFPTVGFDADPDRVAALQAGVDTTGEVDPAEILASAHLHLTCDDADLLGCNVFVVAVPTPVDGSHRPDLGPLIRASRIVGRAIPKGGVVIYESTVYPGATEEDCIPVVAETSGYRFNYDFFAGYSPERVNPGDKSRTLTNIVKVTSGSTPEVADFVDELYRSIIEAGTFRARSIRVAEAAKIVENTQRDVNIALINELSIVFSHLGIDTNEVLDAAATKWNFSRYRPGLVGGHCIGVDPYYLVHKSISAGYIPDIIRQAREINDGMARNAASRLVKTMIQRGHTVNGARVLIVGFTFKENCPDTRNTKVIDLIQQVRDFGMQVEVVDTWADPGKVLATYGERLATALPREAQYDVVILAVPHSDMIADGATAFRTLLAPSGILFDMKAVFPVDDSDLRL